MIKHHYASNLLALGKWIGIVPTWVLAITFGSHIFFKDKAPPKWLVAHEEVHVAQYRKHGAFGFLWQYFWVERGVSYRNKTFEKQAYEISNKVKYGG